MPGGRLTHADRRYVAEALAQGLGYAEIARRLRRPTSTISREVARNGGREGYRAEAAHDATGRRARRRSPFHAPPAPPLDRDDAAVADFRRRYARMMTETGMPSMAARTLVSLQTRESGRMTAAELVGELRVSPASVSKAVAYLEAIGMIGREREPGSRRDTYVVDDGMWSRALLQAIDLQRRWARYAAEGARLLGTDSASGARLAEMAEFAELMNTVLAHELTRHREAFDERRRATG